MTNCCKSLRILYLEHSKSVPFEVPSLNAAVISRLQGSPLESCNRIMSCFQLSLLRMFYHLTNKKQISNWLNIFSAQSKHMWLPAQIHFFLHIPCYISLLPSQHHQIFNEISHALWAKAMPDRWCKPLGWLMNMILFNLNQNHIKVHCHRPQSDVPLNALAKHIKRGNNNMF